jgi:hypothetical protein
MPITTPPPILLICREPLKPGRESAYSAIEEETARSAVALGCPHPYLAAECLTGSAEVWWFNGFESAAEQAHVADAYAKNEQWMAALTQNSARKSDCTLALIEALATYREELSAGSRWSPGAGRFLVITMTGSGAPTSGTVFETADGLRFIVTPAPTREVADARRAIAGAESRVLAVRPRWSFPAAEWVAADPEFWQPRVDR